MSEIELSSAQADAAVKGAEMQVASAQIGYSTPEPDVVVAEIWQGSGIAYSSWAVLRRINGQSWQIFGEPSDTVVSDPGKRVQVTVEGGATFFEVDLPASGKTIRLKLPN